jgi:hypothetical protein
MGVHHRFFLLSLSALALTIIASCGDSTTSDAEDQATTTRATPTTVCADLAYIQQNWNLGSAKENWAIDLVAALNRAAAKLPVELAADVRLLGETFGPSDKVDLAAMGAAQRRIDAFALAECGHKVFD